MKYVIMSLLIIVSCSSEKQSVSKEITNPEFYLTQTEITNPGNYSYLYDNLPTEYGQLCDLIKKQLIHPLEAGRYKKVVSQGRNFEDTIYTSIESILSGLLNYDSSGINPDRKPEDRLILACLHHSMLLASILRENNIPVRIRFGFAPYIGKKLGVDVNISHVICEVWNEDESRWLYVDPDRNMIDFPNKDFITGAEAWIELRNKELDVKKYRSAFFTKEQSILDMLRLDLSYALLDEKMYWSDSGAPEIPKYEQLTTNELVALDSISKLLLHAGSNYKSLTHLRNSIQDFK